MSDIDELYKRYKLLQLENNSLRGANTDLMIQLINAKNDLNKSKDHEHYKFLSDRYDELLEDLQKLANKLDKIKWMEDNPTKIQKEAMKIRRKNDLLQARLTKMYINLKNIVKKTEEMQMKLDEVYLYAPEIGSEYKKAAEDFNEKAEELNKYRDH